jgi:parallel beta-helix repeat protein
MKCIIISFLIFLTQNSYARRVPVSDYPAIHDAAQNALPGDTIVIATGVYTIEGNNRIMVTSRPGPVLVTGETGDPRDVTIQGVTMDTDVVEMIFNLDNCPNWTFQGFTARNTYYHAFKFDRGSTDCQVRNVFMLDNGESGVKGTSDNVAKVYPDRLLVENCKIGYTKPAGSAHPQVEGIDGVGENDWIIRGNHFQNIQKSAFDHAAYAVFTKGNSSRTIIEGNRFEDCFIGASFGGGGTDPIFFRDSDQTYEHRDGIIRNNVMIRCTDAGVYINKGTNCKIYNNTLIQCVLQIQLRFKESSGYVKNNLVLLSSLYPAEPIVRIRDSATLLADTANMFAGGQEFVNIIGPSYSMDAALRDIAPEIDAGVTLAEVPTDFKGTLRPQGSAYDIGAYEFISARISENPPLRAGDDVLLAIYTSGGVKLRMNLPHQTNIELKLFDALGREMAVIANRSFEEGSHSFAIPPSFISGVYFGLLNYDGIQRIAKIILK